MVAWLKLEVQAVVSLVKSKNTKFLAVYEAASAKTAIPVTGTNGRNLPSNARKRSKPTMPLALRDISDVAFLLYRRLLTANREKIVRCIGRQVALAALGLLNLKRSPIPADKDYQITKEDIDNYAPGLSNIPDQPHTRAKLDDEMNTFVDMLGRHLQSEDGLRGKQLAQLTGDFTAQIALEDKTINYKAFKLIFPNQKIDRTAVSREEYFDQIA